MADEFQSFEIEVLPRRGRVFPLVVRSPAGEATGELRIPDDAVFRQMSAQLTALNTDVETLRRLGQKLYRTLFRDAVKELLIASQSRLNGQGLRIQLRIDPSAADAASLPWEFLRDLDDQPLVLRSMPVVRYLPQPMPQPALRTRLPLRVLLTGAQTPPKADVEEELRRVEEALTRLGDRVQVVSEPHLTAITLQRRLAEGFHIWHFVGHGELSLDGANALLRLEDESNEPRPIDAATLSLLLDGSGLRLVVLNACESGRLTTDPFRSLAPALVRAQVPAVLAQQFPAAIEATRGFATEFYTALAAGRPLDACVTSGRRAVLIRSGLDKPDWGVPVIYTRASDVRLFDLDDHAPPPTPVTPPPAPRPTRAHDARVFNLWIEGATPGTPLALGGSYTLVCDVGLPRADAWANAFLGDPFRDLPDDQLDAPVEIMFAAAEVTFVGAAAMTITVARDAGPSGAARLDFMPRRAGAATLRAVLFAHSRVWGEVALALDVQEARAATPVAPAGAPAAALPHLAITSSERGLELALQAGDDTLRATLDISDRELAFLALRVQKVLSEVYRTKSDGSLVYLADTGPIADEPFRATLRQLAQTGYALYQELFYGFGRSAACRALGSRLRQISAAGPIAVTAADDEFCFPWELLYDRDPLDVDNLDPEAFWGYRHRIERLPPALAAAAARQQPPARDPLRIALFDDPQLDAQMGAPIIADQRAALATVPGLAVEVREGRQALLDTLGRDTSVDVVYCFCDISSQQLHLSDGPLSFDDLEAALADAPALEQAPVVVLNGRLTGGDTPLLADGPLPLLARRGVRAVLGTLATMPIQLNAELGQAFVRRFAAGDAAAGDLLDAMRLELLRERQNLLGLLLTLYGSRATAWLRSRRSVTLTIVRAGNGFHATLRDGEHELRARLAIDQAHLDSLLRVVAQTLRDVIFTESAGTYVYQTVDTAIPADVHAATLARLAEQGYQLFQMLFYGPGASDESRALGDALRDLSRQHQLTLTVRASRFCFPWTLVYDADALDLDHVDPERFWGFRHVVAHCPAGLMEEPLIAPQGPLRIAAVVERRLDAQANLPIVAGQLELLRALPGVTVSEHDSSKSLLRLLNDSDHAPDLLHIFCANEADGLRLAGRRLTLDELVVEAPAHRPPLAAAPFVLLTGSRTAVWDADLPRSVLLHLFTRGARGAVGTEADVPLHFADQFARALLERFAAGDRPIGELLLDLRREHLLRKRNVLGLIYALVGNPDIVVLRR